MARSGGTSALVALFAAIGLTLGSGALLGLLEGPGSELLSRGVTGQATVEQGTAMGRLGTTATASVPDATARSAPGEALRPSEELAQPGPARPHARLRHAATPVMLHIEDLGVLASIDRVGVLPDGSMEIPDDISVVGWYATEHRRVSPGDPGTAVIAGHRDSRSQGLGALHDLVRLEPGATISVVHMDGLVSSWQVEETLTTPRDTLPADVLFARDGPPRIALVTCGGTFDVRTRTYSHNTIVLAHLVSGEHAAG